MDIDAEIAFEAFVARSGPSLLHTALLLTGDRGHAEDVLQTVLERVAQRWGRLDGVPEAYARRCVVNLTRDRRRRRATRVSEISLDERVPQRATPDGSAMVDLRAALVDQLRRLPTRQRHVLVLRYFLDLDEAATAEALGMSVGSVKSQASRGLARLRTEALELDPTGSRATDREVRP